MNAEIKMGELLIATAESGERQIRGGDKKSKLHEVTLIQVLSDFGISKRESAEAQRPWPTLAGRLNHPLTSRVEAVRQLQATMPLTPVAQKILERHEHHPGRTPKRA